MPPPDGPMRLTDSPACLVTGEGDMSANLERLLKAAGQAARQEDLNKALQARAEQARKKLIEQQQKEGGAAAPQQ